MEQKLKSCKKCNHSAYLKGYGLCPKCYSGKYTEFTIKKKQGKTDAKSFRQFMIGKIEIPDEFKLNNLKKLKR